MAALTGMAFVRTSASKVNRPARVRLGPGWKRRSFVSCGLALLVGCGPASIAAPDAGPGEGSDAAAADAAASDARLEAPPPTCELAQAPLARPATAHAVLVTPRGFLLGDARGLWRSTGVEERFERVTSLSSGSTVVVTLVRADDGAIFAGLGDGRIRMSRDEGEHWDDVAELPPGSRGRSAPRLHTDGARIVGTVDGFAGVEAVYELDRASGGWIEIVAGDPLEGWGHSGFTLVGVDGGALLATPNGYRSGGLFRLERGAARWERVEGMDGIGYSTVARRGDVVVVASPTGIWAEIDGAYRPALERELGHPLIVSTADGFLGVHSEGVLRSADGLAWDVEALADGSSRAPAVLSEHGGRVATVRGDLGALDGGFVSLSEDRGARWREPSIVSQGFERVATHGDRDGRIAYVSSYPTWSSFDPSTWRRGVWATFSWPLPYGASAVAISRDGAWACASTGCVHRTDDGEVGPTIAMPESPFAHEPTGAFVTRHGLFVSPRPYGTTCGVVQPGLVVLRDEADPTWEDASAGLRSWAPQCAGAPSVATVATMFELEGALWATQAEAYLTPPFPPVVLRSLDGGRRWRAMREDAELVALVRAEAGAFGLFRPGTIEVLDATGEVFAPAPVQPGAVVTDLVVLDGRLVAATADAHGSALWLSDDGAHSWAPLLVDPRIGPITDLDVHGSVLTIASRTSGLWEASGCFER